MPATDESALSDRYCWSRYDNASSGATDWVMVNKSEPIACFY
ncbi:MAG: hypothetical protein ACYDET_09690 [Thermoleophilia bacterium]